MPLAIDDVDALAVQFESDGFVKIAPLFDDAKMGQIEDEVSRYVKEVAPQVPPSDIVYEKDALPDGSRAVRNLWRMEKYSPFFAELAQDPKITSLVRKLVHGEPEVAAVEMFAKPGRVGSAVPFHQDNAYFTLTPPDALTCWIALDDTDEQNGCVYYGRGTHRGGLQPHKPSNVKGNSLMLAEPPAAGETDEVAGVMGRGGAILHHCVLLHRSEPNTSAKARRGLLIVYRGSHCRTDPEAAQVYRQAQEKN